jgi:alanyl-tRNA synthetase
MLGNWSFGDYFKREAIAWAWELMTEVWGLPKERLHATVYREDAEAEAIWKEVTDIDPRHISRHGEKDNFWEMGETGPCGPCSEIHIDLTEDGSGAGLVNADSPEVIELWNLVFIQYNRRGDGTLVELPAKHVDTGMGFERVAAVLQGKKSNYDTDVFQPLIQKLAELSGRAYEGEDGIAMRVIADHVRTLSIAIADGVLPSNDGRGYVLRRLLRRAVRFGRKLGFTDPFMTGLVPVLEGQLGGVFPELVRNRDSVLRAIRAEEESFATTLDRGIVLFDEVVARLKAENQPTFSGHDAFKLYDTFGFPLDLTRLMAAEQSLSVDEESFNSLMENQRTMARSARKDALLASEMDLIADLVNQGVKSTFCGYGATEGKSEIIALLADGASRDALAEGEEGVILLQETPFYAESGGQLGDQGVLRTQAGEFEVWDTQRPAEGLILHVGKVVQGAMASGATAAAVVNAERRKRMERHHSATHLLNGALREVVDARVSQKGSLVAPDRLRFDFNHYEQIPWATLEQIERRVNEWIMQNDPVQTYGMALKDVPGSGIIAVFDEKYGDEVRVVDIGGYSKELCGGTHVGATGELGAFRIVGESSVASGVRRIEAVCGMQAFEMTRREHELVQHLSQRFSATSDELLDRVEALLQQNRKLEKELKQQALASAASQAGELGAKARDVGGIQLIAEVVGEQPMDVLRTMMDDLRSSLPSGVIVLGSRAGGKACFMASVTEDLVARGLHAGTLIGQIARLAGGGGGGQPHKAQAGGKDGSKVAEAIGAVDAIVSDMLG